jgi:hypothetical protein
MVWPTNNHCFFPKLLIFASLKPAASLLHYHNLVKILPSVSCQPTLIMSFPNLKALLPVSHVGAVMEPAGQAASHIKATLASQPVADTLQQAAKVVVDEAGKFASENPLTTAAVIGGVTLVAAPALVVAPVLSAVGFTSTGVGAGSVAAGVQSGLGSVAAGSMFAGLQSAAAGGYGLAMANGVVQGAGAALSVGAAAANHIKSKL